MNKQDLQIVCYTYRLSIKLTDEELKILIDRNKKKRRKEIMWDIAVMILLFSCIGILLLK